MATPSTSQQTPSLSAADVKQQEAQRIDMRRELADRPVQQHEILRGSRCCIALFAYIYKLSEYNLFRYNCG